MKCPICGKPVKLRDADAPFCGERCRVIDLGNWASEKYVVSTPVRREGSAGWGGSSGEDQDTLEPTEE